MIDLDRCPFCGDDCSLEKITIQETVCENCKRNLTRENRLAERVSDLNAILEIYKKENAELEELKKGISEIYGICGHTSIYEPKDIERIVFKLRKKILLENKK